MVVEAHPVEQATVGSEPEQPGLRIARLGDRGHRAHLGIAEAERTPHLETLAVLVESRGQTQGGGEVHPEYLAGQDGIGRRAQTIHQPARRSEGRRGTQRCEHQGMYTFGRHHEKQPQQDGVQHHITGAVNGPPTTLPRIFLRRNKTRRLPSV